MAALVVATIVVVIMVGYINIDEIEFDSGRIYYQIFKSESSGDERGLLL